MATYIKKHLGFGPLLGIIIAFALFFAIFDTVWNIANSDPFDRQVNVTTSIRFPLINASGVRQTDQGTNGGGDGSCDCTIAVWSDSTAVASVLEAATNTVSPVEDAATGIYQLAIANTEISAGDYYAISCVDSTGADFIDQMIEGRLTVGDGANMATTTSGETVNTAAAAALTALNLDELMQSAAEGTNIADNSVIAKLVSKESTADWDDFVNTTDSLEANRDNIGTLGAALTDLGGMSTAMKAEVESEANDALVDERLDHLVAVADGDDPVNGSIIADLASSSATSDWSTYVNTTESLQAIKDGAATLADINAEVDTAIETYKLDHLIAVADGDDPVNGSIIADMCSLSATSDWSTFVNTTDSLQAIRDRGDAAWVDLLGPGGTAQTGDLYGAFLSGRRVYMIRQPYSEDYIISIR